MHHPAIIYVIGSLAMGGAERQLANLARSLAARGHAVAVFVLEAGGPLTAELAQAGLAVIDGGYDSGASFPAKVLRLARAELRLIRTVFRRRPTIVHAFLPLAGFLAVIAGKIARTPKVVVARRALGTHQDRHPYWRAVDRWVARHADIITANARAVAVDTARREHVPLHDIRVIPNGIDVERFPPERRGRAAMRAQFALGASDIAFVCVANLIAYKGHRELLDAFAVVVRARPECRLFLVGDDRGIGPDLVLQASKLGIGSQVVQLGHRDDVPAVLEAMDVAVLASHEEGMSNAILECLAAGLPVVATNVGGTPEILGGQPGCWMVPAGDTSHLARAMLDALAERKDTAQRDFRRQTAARRFSIEAMVERHLEVYKAD